MGYRGPLARAVATAITAAPDDRRDAGTVTLARRYAELIDDATVAAKYREPLEQLRRAIELLGMFELENGAVVDRAEKALAKVSDALAAHSVASDLGPKLLAALTALGLTPAARGAGTKEGGQDGAAAAGKPKPESTFERLRRERAERARTHGAAPVDPPAS